ncbi:MAG: efflux transporter outer membrane subunit [Bacteroidales bacterium]|nr:efflux transporter outer membrane subunit [Bacteroidales bacterium]
MNRSIIYYLIVVILVGISGCAVGPNFQKPEIESPEYFSYDSLRADTVLNLRWWELFKDDQLIALIDTTIINNKDIQIAASRVVEARYVLGYTKANQWPVIGYSGNAQGTNIDLSGNSGSQVNSFSALGNVNWEIGFWGKYRRANEASREELLATQYAHRAVMISLISEVASTYFLLLDFNSRLEIAKRTLDSRLEGLSIMQSKFDHGTIPELELNQAEIQEAIAASAIPNFQRNIAQTEHALSVLLGKNPGSILEINTLVDQKAPPDIPGGIPSDLLERRTDVMEAEHIYAAQNARIGVAQAMRWPSFNLTAGMGVASTDLSTLLSGASLAWSVGGGFVGPIFNFGRNKRRVQIERQKTEQALLNYENTVLNAFRDVEDALIEVHTYKYELNARIRQSNAAQNANILSQKRYSGGVTSYLEVLDSERTFFNSELATSETYRNRLNSYVKLYKALGGGWISPEEEQAADEEAARLKAEEEAKAEAKK